MNIIKPKDLEQPFRAGIVISRAHEMVTQRLHEAAVRRLNEYKITSDLITLVWVPTPVEIPLAAQSLIDTDEIHVIITLGAVITNETPHSEYICEQVSLGCQQVMLDNATPVVFGVVTTDDEQTALDFAGGAKGNIGHDAVNTAFDMLSALRQIARLKF